ncbi:lipocalin-like domain-containing protein [Actinokineospora sp. NBRC 105648]|uniref:lipocalin-like domain-containing protein n=1 Tax=Actinokineospora sp. NBRC 105648 TaxID=3032206 RepID=UPI0024A06332|nr:lipocalin-like domain-containing protein [Actinokineospora sp. NBRC 105648]GLZ38909.1 hypothetical protein Acsp05_25330 [Actinokineospora sp. NBRC 105648]
MRPADLVGAWALAGYVEVDATGTESTGPLGEHPVGLLIYQADGHMSVSMMRTGGAGPETFMGYAGTWRLDGPRVRHAVVVSAHPNQVDTELVRDIEGSGDVVVLHGSAVVDGRAVRRKLTWRRESSA